MRHLCDSNVLVAIAARRHSHHEAALTWWDSLPERDEAVICRMAQLSFLRLLTTESVMREEVRTNVQAILALENFRQDSRTSWIFEEPADLEERWLDFCRVDLKSSGIWMDAYLAAFALGYNLRFVTFDRGFERFQERGLDVRVLRN